MFFNDIYHLVCAASIIDKNGRVFTGISKKLPLPREVSEQVRKGFQFGIVIREFEKKMDKTNEGLKNLIAELINRTDSFSEAIEIAIFKYENSRIF